MHQVKIVSGVGSLEAQVQHFEEHLEEGCALTGSTSNPDMIFLLVREERTLQLPGHPGTVVIALDYADLVGLRDLFQVSSQRMAQ